jgi:hypothetical protein
MTSFGDPYDLSSGVKGFKRLALEAAKARRKKRRGPTGLTGDVGPKGEIGSRGPGPCPKGADPGSKASFDEIAYKMMHDPDFDPLLLLQRLLASYIENYKNWGGVPKDELDELIEKYLK